MAQFGDPGEPGGEEAEGFMVELIDGKTVVCDLTQERTHDRRVGWCYRASQDEAEALIRADDGLAREWPLIGAGPVVAEFGLFDVNQGSRRIF